MQSPCISFPVPIAMRNPVVKAAFLISLLPAVCHAQTEFTAKELITKKFIESLHIEQVCPDYEARLIPQTAVLLQALKDKLFLHSNFSEAQKTAALPVFEAVAPEFSQAIFQVQQQIKCETTLPEIATRVYAKALTLEELQTMTDFYNSPIGKKFNELTPRILEEGRRPGTQPSVMQSFSPQELTELDRTFNSPVFQSIKLKSPAMIKEAGEILRAKTHSDLDRVNQKYWQKIRLLLEEKLQVKVTN